MSALPTSIVRSPDAASESFAALRSSDSDGVAGPQCGSSGQRAGAEQSAVSRTEHLTPHDICGGVATPQFPPDALCAICTRACVGELHQEPLGRGDALVNVCSSCATEVPRERDHLFGGVGDGRNAGDGDGNRRKGNHL